MAGKTWKWTPKRQAALLEALAQGQTRRGACAIAGVSYQTFYNALSDDSVFFDAVEAAEAEAEATAISVAVDWPPSDKADARYWLKHRRRADWGDHAHIETSGEQRLIWEYAKDSDS